MEKFKDTWIQLNSIKLKQNYSIVLMTYDFYDDVVELVNGDFEIYDDDIFELFSSSIYELLQQESKAGKIAYIEAYYYSEGVSESAILFDNGKVIVPAYKTNILWSQIHNEFFRRIEYKNAINIVLKELGVYKNNNMNEFDSIKLGEHMMTE